MLHLLALTLFAISPAQAQCGPELGRVRGFYDLKAAPEAIADAVGKPKVQEFSALHTHEEDAASLLLGFMPVLHLTPDRELLGQSGLTLDELAALIPRPHKVMGGEIHIPLDGRAELADPHTLIASVGAIAVPASDGRAVTLADLTDAWIGERQASRVAQETPAPAAGLAPPLAPLRLTRQDLILVNPASQRARVFLDGTEIGRLGGRCEGVIYRVKPGSYEVTLRYPDGYKVARTVETREAAAP